jgi:hypothetical protein
MLIGCHSCHRTVCNGLPGDGKISGLLLLVVLLLMPVRAGSMVLVVSVELEQDESCPVTRTIGLRLVFYVLLRSEMIWQ